MFSGWNICQYGGDSFARIKLNFAPIIIIIAGGEGVALIVVIC